MGRGGSKKAEPKDTFPIVAIGMSAGGPRDRDPVPERHAAEERAGLRHHPAPRADPQKPAGRIARQADQDAGGRDRGGHAGRARSGPCHRPQQDGADRRRRAQADRPRREARTAPPDRQILHRARRGPGRKGDRDRPHRRGKQRHRGPARHQECRRDVHGAGPGDGQVRFDAAPRDQHRPGRLRPRAQ